MTKTTIEITYYEDFGENKIASRVYNILRENDLNPVSVHTDHWANRGVGETRYVFYGFPSLSNESNNCLSDESKLKKMLQEVNGIDVKITHR